MLDQKIGQSQQPKKRKSTPDSNLVNGIEDPESEYFLINSIRREFFHKNSTTISCRTRGKKNHAEQFRANIRLFILDDKAFKMAYNITSSAIKTEDESLLRTAALHYFDKRKDEDLKPEIFYNWIGTLSKAEIKGILQLDDIASTRLLGYEKEFFYLKCYITGVKPWEALRICYHVIMDENLPPVAPIELQWLLDKLYWIKENDDS